MKERIDVSIDRLRRTGRPIAQHRRTPTCLDEPIKFEKKMQPASDWGETNQSDGQRKYHTRPSIPKMSVDGEFLVDQ